MSTDDLRNDDLRNDDLRNHDLRNDGLRNKEDLRNTDDLRRFMAEIVPYWRTLGLELMEAAPGRAVFEANVRPGLLQNGVLHGGVLASIADSACAVAAIARVF